MKTPLTPSLGLFSQAAALALLIQMPGSALAQDKVLTPPPPATGVIPHPPVPKADNVDPTDLEPPQPDSFQVEEGLRRVQVDARRAMRDAERQLNGFRFGFAGPDARRIEVIPSDSATEDAIRQSRDDLAVMATILGRAANPDRGRRSDLLVELKDWRVGGGRDLEAIQIEGYGAIFFLGVEYPLVAPSAPEEKPAEAKSSRDTTWEKTRRELLGPGGEPADDDPDMEPDAPPARAFDPNRVAQLEQRLKEALRHAANLRGLGAEDWIVLQVTGPGPDSRPGKSSASGSPVDRYGRLGFVRRGGGSTQLVLRIRKSAADKFSGGGTSLAEFVKEIKVSRRVETPGPAK